MVLLIRAWQKMLLLSLSLLNQNGKTDGTERLKIQPFAFPSDLSVGSHVRILCSVEGIVKGLTFQWKKDGSQITDNEEYIKISNTEGFSVLEIKNLKIKNVGNYTCLVRHSDLASATYSAKLSVKDPLHWIHEPRDTVLILGASALLNCVVKGFPHPQISWEQRNAKSGDTWLNILSQNDRVKVLTNGSLLIKDSLRSDEGYYQCRAYNGLHRPLSKIIYLKVFDKLRIQPFEFPSDLTMGRNVRVFCSVEGSGGNDLHFQWFKNGTPLKNGENNVLISVHPDGFSALELKSVQASDIGNYSCGVKSTEGTAGFSAALVVRAKPTWIQEPRDTTVLVGDTSMFHCQANGYPLPDVEWTRFYGRTGDDLVVYRQNPTWKVFQNGSLILDHVSIRDDGHFKCTAKNGIGQPLVKIVNLSVIEICCHVGLLSLFFLTTGISGEGGPEILPFRFADDITLGGSARALCAVKGLGKDMIFKWKKDGRLLENEKDNINFIFSEGLSVLNIKMLKQENIGNYTCDVKGPSGFSSFTTSLKIQVPPTWSIIPTDLKVAESGRFLMHCLADGYPTPSYKWYRSRDIGRTNFIRVIGPNVKEFSNGSLMITNIASSDKGTYKCTVNNGVGQSLVQLITITVSVPARFEEKFGVVTAQKGESARLQCNAQGDQPLSVTWSNSSNTLSKTSGSGRYEIFETLTPKGINSELIIRETLPQDGAIYSCLAENEHGRDERKVKLLIQEVPSPPPGVSVREVWTRSSSITWLVPYSGNSPISNYIVQYWRDHKRTRRLNEKTVPSSQTFAMIKNLQPGTSYIVTIIAENSVGKSLPSDPAMLTTGEEEPDAPPMDISVHAKGTNTITVMWKAPPHENWNGQLKGYYVGYRVIDLSETYSYETEQFSPNLEHDHFLTNLMKGTKYGIIVKAFNAAGTGPPTQEILVSTLDGDLPASPKLYVQSTTRSTVTLKWDVDSPSHASVTGYTIQYRRESGRWHQATTVPLENNYYTVTGLQDDTVYEFYVTAANKYGAGDPSEIITVITGDIDSGFASSLSGHHGHGYMDLAIIVPVAAAVAAVGVVVAVSCVWQRKIRLRHRLERAMSERTYTPYAGIPVGQVTVGQCFPDMDKTWPPGHSDNNPPISNPDPYSAVPPRIQNGDLRKASSTQEMRTYFTQDTRIQGLSGSKQDVRQIRNSQYSNSLK
ncbi:cell adhesion molecule Dscam1-like isoform X2 [Tachypleus tridentatus]|uniref:cell adhesion molecule Dscam1-like isoform X2 n=1 Tax=Tachypleus tridentatus TaxID=6853 RepID=UPI003FD10458